MNNFGTYLTPQEAYDLHKKEQEKNPKVGCESLKWYIQQSKNKKKCYVCEAEGVWKMVGLGMCFSCVTGEADASDDYELVAYQGD